MNAIISFASNTSGGGFYHISKFIKELTSMDIQGIHVIIPISYTEEVAIPFLRVSNPNRSAKARREIKNYIAINNINLFYTVAGPVNLRLNIYHISGISNAWLYSWYKLKYIKFLNLSGFISVLIGLRNLWSVDGYVFQSDFSKSQFKNFFYLEEWKCNVVPNAVISLGAPKTVSCSNDNVLVPMSLYAHKGLNDIIHAASKLDNFCFDLTCDPIEGKMGTNVRFLGEYKPEDELTIFSKFEIIVLPSHLETISGWMLAAAILEKDVLVRDCDFNRNFFLDESVTYFNTKEDLVRLLGDNRRLRKKAQAKVPIITYHERVKMILNILKRYNDQESR